MKITHFKFIGEQVDEEYSSFNLNIQEGRSLGDNWGQQVGGKSFKSKGKKKKLSKEQGENKVTKKKT